MARFLAGAPLLDGLFPPSDAMPFGCASLMWACAPQIATMELPCVVVGVFMNVSNHMQAGGGGLNSGCPLVFAVGEA